MKCVLLTLQTASTHKKALAWVVIITGALLIRTRICYGVYNWVAKHGWQGVRQDVHNYIVGTQQHSDTSCCRQLRKYQSMAALKQQKYHLYCGRSWRCCSYNIHLLSLPLFIIPDILHKLLYIELCAQHKKRYNIIFITFVQSAFFFLYRILDKD